MSRSALTGIVVVVLGLIVVLGAWALMSPNPAEEATPSPTAATGPTQDIFVQEVPSGFEPTISPDLAATATPAATKAVVISMTDTGFSPSSVTIPVGTTVTFVNNGQASHWPASDLHPTHQILPGFDAKRGLSTGETYSYTFTKAGTWQFHDHLLPSLKGSVVAQ